MAKSKTYDLNHMPQQTFADREWQTLSESIAPLALLQPALRSKAEPWKLDAGEVLFRIGDPIRAVYAVVEGEIRLIRRDRNGSEIVLQRSRGGFFAEASLGSKTYHCDAVATLRSELIRFPVNAFRDALGEDAAFRDAWMAHLAKEVRKLRAQCERLNLHKAADRIIHYIESEGVAGSIRLNQTRKAWAAELGLSHEVLYRTVRRLQDEGVIEVEGEHITLAA